MKHLHLVPILTLFPLIIGLLLFTQLDITLDPVMVAIMALSYIVLNVVYAIYKKTFQVHTLVEFTLVATIAYFVMTWTV